MKPDFRDSVVYQIYCLNPIITDVYVGSTTNFTVRKNNHKYSCKKSCYKVYKFIRDNGGWENWNMVIIKKYPNLTERYQLLKKERKWIKKMNPTLNKTIPNPVKYTFMTNDELIAHKKQQEINESYENHGHIVSLSERVKEHNKRYG